MPSSDGWKNLIPIKKGQLSHEEAAERGRKGGKACAAKKALISYVKNWGNSPAKQVDQRTLEELGFGPNAQKKATLIIPLLKNAHTGDVRSIKLIIELMQEDEKQKTEIKLLKEQIKTQQLEQEKLKQEIASYKALNGDDAGVEVVNDVPSTSD